VQGASAHFAIGMAFDEGAGDDQYNPSAPVKRTSLGAAHDFSAALLWDDGGADRYLVPPLGAGAANCTGVGLFIDAAGEDTYLAQGPVALGTATEVTACGPNRVGTTHVSLMVDGAGRDTYGNFLNRPGAADGARWSTSAPGAVGVFSGGFDLRR
jgi:hypothetical protein